MHPKLFKAEARHGNVSIEYKGEEPFTISRSDACVLAIDLLYAVACATDYHDPDTPHDALAALDKWYRTIKESK
jgi:hypothetical protein